MKHLTENGHEYAIICDLTKYLLTIPVANNSTKTVANAIFQSCVLKIGPKKTFIADRVTKYKN